MVNTLLLGTKGLSMLGDAYEMASQILMTEKLDLHPDYLYVDLPKDKKSIGVDDVLPIVQKGYVKPVLAEKSVVIINHMDCLTDAAQNKLLLTLESNENLFVIGVAYRDTLLTTVKSRMKIVEYKPYSKANFFSLFEGKYSKEELPLLYYASGGCPGLVHGFADQTKLFLELFNACQCDDAKGVLKSLHIVHEKDPLAVYNDRNLLLAVFHVLQYSFVEKADRILRTDGLKAAECVAVIDRLLEDEAKCLAPQYTKNDFFCTITYLIEKGLRRASNQ